MTNIFKKIIEEICNEDNIKFKILSKDLIIMLEKNGKTKFIYGYKFDFNSHALGLIADDKYALYEVLKQKSIPVIDHKIVFNNNNHLDYANGCNTYEYVKDYFIKNNNHIVIKPNNGTCGNNVYNVTNINQIDNILNKIFINNFSISICPFYKIKHEYRVIMLNGEAKLIYAKYLPVVIGDGIKTIKQLLLEFNHGYFLNKLNDPKYDRILNIQEKFEYNWKFNLSQGAIAKNVDNEKLSGELTKLAVKVSNEINLNFGSIDIIETTDNKLLVLEVNSGVMLDNYIRLKPNGYNIAKEIYKQAIECLFKN